MGYRSDVAFAVNFELLGDHLDDLVGLADQILYDDKDGKHYVLFVIGAIKWGYCGELEEWIKSLNDEEYKLIVLGEELDDNQYSGDLDLFDLSISRSINYNEDCDEFDTKDKYDNLKVDLNILSKETIFRKIQDVHRAQLERQAKSSEESQPA